MNPDTTVLIAEDDDGHAALIEKNLRRAGIEKPCHRLRDGQETLDFFLGPHTLPQAKKVCRYLLILDINLPRINGIDVLRRMKDHEVLKRVPVLMLSTTDNPQEVDACHALGCNFYLTKPIEAETFAQVIIRLGSFLDIVTVPTIRRNFPSTHSLN
ncbi:MAG: response regulator [Nitrospirales bacterium]